MASDTLFVRVLRWHQDDASRCEIPVGDAADILCADLDVSRASLMRNVRTAREALALLEPTCAPSPEPAAVASSPAPRDACPPAMGLADDDEVELDADEPTNDAYRYYPETHEYVFRIKGDSFGLRREEVADLVWWYTRSAGNATQREVTRRAQQEHGRTLTRDYLRRMLLVLGITKDAPPWAPHDLERYTATELNKLKFARLQAEAEGVDTREASREYRRLWQQEAKLRRDQDRIVEALAGALEQRPTPTLERVEVASTQTMAVVGLYDCHIGKRDTSGAGLDHSVEVMVSAVRKLAGRIASMHAPERIVVAVGGDYLHVDTIGATTTAGTAQDVDATSSRILAAGIDALITCVDTLAQLAHVEVVIIPGNHDRILASAVMLAVSRHYASHDGVEVQVHHSTRAYVRYGRCLLGLEHGDGPKPADLATIMSTERAADWGATTCKAWLVGHLHHVHEREVAGCHVLQAPSLAGADAWHNRKGYVTSTRALRAYLFDRVEGMVGQVQVGA